MRKLLLSALALLALAGCANVPLSAAQAAVALTGAERVALAYATLPRCGGGITGACSDAVVVGQIAAADRSAYAAVKAAEASGTSASVAAASAAIAALAALVPQAVAGSTGGKP